MKLDKRDFDKLRELIHEVCGLTIADEKQYLITHRLLPMAKSLGCSSWSELHARIACKADGRPLREKLITAITTRETSFFRDSHPFDSIREKVLPGLVDAISKRKASGPASRAKARIWCAASSTGQEPYSLAMLVDEYLGETPAGGAAPDDFDILATDISDAALDQARQGTYSNLEINRGLPRKFKKYFEKHNAGHRVVSWLRKRVRFEKVNLTHSLAKLGRFDFVCCRNVLLYFDNPTKRRILDQIHAMLDRGGYLLLGASEGLYGITERFESEKIGGSILFKKT